MNYLWSLLSMTLFVCLVGFTSCSKDDDDPPQPEPSITVSPTSVSMLSDKGSIANVTVTSNVEWTLTGCPDWLNVSASSGNGTTSIILTALNENWSDEARTAELMFHANDLLAKVSVNQLPSLPTNLRVTTSNMTIMCDGFACDLQFGDATKGYREAFFTETAMQTMTDRDIFNKLMEKTEYSGSVDYTFLPDWVEPGTNLIYCVAAYGNESNADGSHKYGPITVERIKTKARTIYDDMYLTSSYNSSRWTVNAARQGNYGQRCDEFYYLAAEDDIAEEFYTYSNYFTYALLAHLVFKPEIAANRNWNYCNGPQTLNFGRTGNKFFCTTWGKDRDTKEFSAELSEPVYRDLSASSVREMKRMKLSSLEKNQQPLRPTQEQIMKMRNSLKVIKVNK